MSGRRGSLQSRDCSPVKCQQACSLPAGTGSSYTAKSIITDFQGCHENISKGKNGKYERIEENI